MIYKSPTAKHPNLWNMFEVFQERPPSYDYITYSSGLGVEDSIQIGLVCFN